MPVIIFFVILFLVLFLVILPEILRRIVIIIALVWGFLKILKGIRWYFKPMSWFSRIVTILGVIGFVVFIVICLQGFHFLMRGFL